MAVSSNIAETVSEESEKKDGDDEAKGITKSGSWIERIHIYFFFFYRLRFLFFPNWFSNYRLLIRESALDGDDQSQSLLNFFIKMASSTFPVTGKVFTALKQYNRYFSI